MRRTARPSTISYGDWIGLYLTGLLLVIFLLAHIWAVHYAVVGEVAFTFEAVHQKMQNPVFVFLDLGLLLLAIYHGLVGARRFVVDLEILGRTSTRIFSWLLVVAGLVALYYGWLIFRAFAV